MTSKNGGNNSTNVQKAEIEKLLNTFNKKTLPKMKRTAKILNDLNNFLGLPNNHYDLDTLKKPDNKKE